MANTDPIEQASEWLRTQGYALEHAAASAFQSAGFRALQGQTYRDLSTSKRRDIDVVATAQLSRHAPELIAVIECKRTAKPWIARQTFIPGPDLAWPPIATLGVARGLSGRNQWIVASKLPFPRNVEGNISFAVVQAERGEDVAFSAMSQAVSAASGLIFGQGPRTPAMALPIVLIDKPLLTLAYGTDGTENLASVPWSRVLWSGSDVPTVVDVVTLQAIGEYAANLRYEFGALAETIHLERVPFENPSGVA